jgi:hypothetical protein
VASKTIKAFIRPDYKQSAGPDARANSVTCSDWT